jgi:hypothetical protein
MALSCKKKLKHCRSRKPPGRKTKAQWAGVCLSMYNRCKKRKAKR